MIDNLYLTVILFGFVCLCVPIFWPADFEAPHWVKFCSIVGVLLSCAAVFILSLIKIWTY